MKSKHQKELLDFYRNGDFEESEGGLIIHKAVMLRGKYTSSVNGGQDEQVDYNLIPYAAANYLLNAGTEPTATTTYDDWYIGLNSSATAPTTAWTPTDFTSNEITDSVTLGYSEATRVEWDKAAPSNGIQNNYSSRASFTIVDTGAATLTVRSAGLLSNSAKGNSTGVLLSAVVFGTARVLNDADVFELGYQIELVDT